MVSHDSFLLSAHVPFKPSKLVTLPSPEEDVGEISTLRATDEVKTVGAGERVAASTSAT